MSRKGRGARFDDALQAALRMTARIEGNGGQVNGYPVTPAQIAAHIIASAVSRRPSVKGGLDAAMDRMAGNAVGIMNAILPLTAERSGQSVSGTTAISWSVSPRHVHIGGDTFHMSAAVPGLHLRLPDVEADDTALLGTYRAHLVQAGVRPELVAGATAETVKGKHGTWTRFSVPMTDERLTARGEIEGAAHLCDAAIAEHLRYQAKMACEVQDNLETLTRFADQAQADAIEKTRGVDGMRIGTVHLQSVARFAAPPNRQRVTLYVPVTVLNETLATVDDVAVYSSELGLPTMTGNGMDDIVKRQSRRLSMIEQHGGLRIEMTGMAILRSLGHDVEAMIAKAIASRHHGNDQAADRLDVDDGRIFARASLSRDVKWRRDRIEVRTTLPDTVMEALVGRPASLVVGHPAFDGTVVSRVKRERNQIHIRLEPRWEVRP